MTLRKSLKAQLSEAKRCLLNPPKRGDGGGINVIPKKTTEEKKKEFCSWYSKDEAVTG